MNAMLGKLFSVEGKTALVTGGAKGVGAMIAQSLCEAGANVIIAARDAKQGEAFVADLKGPGEASFIAADLGNMAGVEALADSVKKRCDSLAILVNNAGMFSASAIEDAKAAQWDMEMGLNLRAPFFLTQALLPLLKASVQAGDPARVINIGSIGALWGNSSNGAYAYASSKAAVHQLTRMLASDLTKQGVTVNAIAPGFFPSDMTDGFFQAVEGLKEQMEMTIPAGRLGSKEDIGGAVIFLCSRAGAYVSGAVLPVEGALWQA